MLIEEKHTRQAQHEFEAMLKVQPKDLTVLYMLGLLEIQMEETKSAERRLTAFLDLLADNPKEDRDPTSALLLLSQIAEDRKDNTAALKWLDRVEAPDAYVGVQIRRAEIYAKEGNLSGARKLLANLTLTDPAQQVQVIAAEAQILRDANRAQEAMAIWPRASSASLTIRICCTTTRWTPKRSISSTFVKPRCARSLKLPQKSASV